MDPDNVIWDNKDKQRSSIKGIDSGFYPKYYCNDENECCLTR